MAIDKASAKNLLDEIDSLVKGIVPEDILGPIEQAILGPVREEISKFITESREPRIYVMGRSGHGKSSLINCLCNQVVAEPGDVKPKTSESEIYKIEFPESHAKWEVIDSRGLFESTPPEGGAQADTVQLVVDDVKTYEPDVILHVIAAPEARTLHNDLIAYSTICDQIAEHTSTKPPTLIILNRVDTLGNPRDWPPEKSRSKRNLIRELLDYVAKDILQVRVDAIDSSDMIKGYRVEDSQYLGIIPASCLFEDRWNLDTVHTFIGQQLPEDARLDFYQAIKRKDLLQKMSTSMIRRFSSISLGIGAIPVPLVDLALLTPLHLVLIAIIGGLSCRPLSKKTANEYIAAAGMATGVGLGARIALRFGLYGLKQASRQILKLAPGVGTAISAGLAASTTYAIGKSAEKYFFSGEVIVPKKFDGDYEKEVSEDS